ncbi:MAG: DUF3299 domain-containing protein [Pirellulales bacterium]
MILGKPSYVLAIALCLGVVAPTCAEEPIRNITFDALKFEIKKGDPFERKLLTQSIEKLDGKRLRLRGFILPPYQTTGLTKFVLMRDNMECCFGPQAYIYDCVIVDLPAGESIDYTTKPVAVEGTFEIEEFKNPNGTHMAIYHLAADKVR